MSLAERLHKHRDATAGAGGCWPWTGARNARGYGTIHFDGRTQAAHRLAWVAANGVIGVDERGRTLHVLHRCDNPPCCNPAHLFLGTHLDNVADRQAKGRHVKCLGDANGSRRHPERRPRGDAHWTRSRMTEVY